MNINTPWCIHEEYNQVSFLGDTQCWICFWLPERTRWMMPCVGGKQAVVTSSGALVPTKTQCNLFPYGWLPLCHHNSWQRKEKLGWPPTCSTANPFARSWLCPFYQWEMKYRKGLRALQSLSPESERRFPFATIANESPLLLRTNQGRNVGFFP